MCVRTTSGLVSGSDPGMKDETSRLSPGMKGLLQHMQMAVAVASDGLEHG